MSGKYIYCHVSEWVGWAAPPRSSTSQNSSEVQISGITTSGLLSCVAYIMIADNRTAMSHIPVSCNTSKRLSIMIKMLDFVRQTNLPTLSIQVKE